MRSEFNKAFKEHRQEGKSYSAEYKLGALWAWDYRQSKVDELQKNINLLKEALDIKEQLNQKLREREDELQKQKSLQELEINQIAQANQQWQLKCDELQKRVDTSLIAFEKLKEEINELHGQCDLHLIKYLEEKSQVLEQALKGDQ